jgi:PAS domain S-box-containing protein
MQSDAGATAQNARPVEPDDRYRALTESAPDAIVTIDERSVNLSVNRATERIFGWAAGELVGQSLSLLMPESYRSRHTAGMAHYLATGKRRLDWTGIALRGLRKDGREFPMEISFGEFVDGNRHIFSGFMRDISERIEQEQRIDRASSELQRALDALEQRVQEAEEARQAADDANAAKGQFLRMMSHELRTPLNAIGGYVDLLETGVRGPVTAGQREDLGRIRSAQARLLSLINDVLNFAKLEQGLISLEIGPVDVSALVKSLQSMIEPQLRAKDIHFDCAACGSDLTISADSQKLGQVLLNLLSNAIKFTPIGGRISVSVEQVEECVLLSVQDNGPGIPAERLRAVFQPFVQIDSTLTRVHGGSGLGLSISRELAHAMGGTISVASEPGSGAKFTVSLPVGSSRDEVKAATR